MLFMITAIMMIIHLLNMLIAIMGNTFSERSIVGEQIMVRDHLTFVVDNFHLINLVFPNIKRVKYLIIAFHSNDSEGNESDKYLDDLVFNNRSILNDATEN